MTLISLRHRIRSGWLTVLATATLVALATPGGAQTVPPPASPLSSADLAKVHLTAARNALSDVTQLPAAAQLAGETRTRVQQLITNFNELIGKGADWRAPYAKVEANLSTLLGSETPAPATATPGAVGTSGMTSDLDPAIRAKLVEFRAHLDKFKAVASAAAPAAAAAPPADAPPTPATTPPATPPATSPAAPTATTPPATPAAAPPATPPPATPPATMPPAPTAPTAAPTPAPAAPPASPDPRPDAPSPADAVREDAQNVLVVARDVLLHVEALEVILGAQARVQKEATAAAGGAVVSSETPSGSTRTTVTGPDVTLNAQQLEQITAHLAEMRRLLEKK
jgi:hypothetical protein